jgi:hypothetical protein
MLRRLELKWLDGPEHHRISLIVGSFLEANMAAIGVEIEPEDLVNQLAAFSDDLRPALRSELRERLLRSLQRDETKWRFRPPRFQPELSIPIPSDWHFGAALRIVDDQLRFDLTWARRRACEIDGQISKEAEAAVERPDLAPHTPMGLLDRLESLPSLPPIVVNLSDALAALVPAPQRVADPTVTRATKRPETNRGYRESDRALVAQAIGLHRAEPLKYPSRSAAIGKVIGAEGQKAQGSGTFESKVKRLFGVWDCEALKVDENDPRPTS